MVFVPLTIDLPPGLVRADLAREKVRSGHYLTWTNQAGTFFRLGQVSVWGAGFQNISSVCRLKGHKNCKRAGLTLNLSYEDMEDWLLAGVGLHNETLHMQLPVAFIATTDSVHIVHRAYVLI